MSTKFTSNIPHLIEKRLIGLDGANQEIAAHKSIFEIREAELFEEVCNKKDDHGKPVYSNDTSRNNALILAKSKSIQFYEIQEMLYNAETKRVKIHAEIEALKMNFKLYLLDCELVIALAKT